MEGDELDLRNVLAVLRRQQVWIYGSLGFSLAVALGILLWLTPPYSASSLILHDPLGDRLIEPRPAITGTTENARIDSQVELIGSDALLLRVLDGDVGQLASLRSSLAVDRVDDTHLISIEVRSPSPEDAAATANAIADAYIADQVDQKIAAIDEARHLVEQRMALSDASQPTREQLADRLQELNLASYLQLADSRIVSPALVPISPISPNIRAIVAIALVLGLLGGLCLALAAENLRAGFKNPEQMAAALGLPATLSIPEIRMSKPGNCVLDNPLSAYSEALRRLKANIEMALPNLELGKVILITSTTAREGKTTTALALARTCALAGQSTLLLDGNLRTPGIHRLVSTAPTHGLRHALERPTVAFDISQVARSDVSAGLTILAGSHDADQPTDRIINGKNFARLIAAARRTYDIIIIDAPQIGSIVDPLYLARYADLIVFLATPHGGTEQRSKNALASLRTAINVALPIIGVVNRQERVREPALKTNAHRIARVHS